jgi:hypothetical protein
MKHASVGIMALRPGMCACLVPEEPAPQYCGLPATHRFRMCEHHAKAYLTTTNARRQAEAEGLPAPPRSGASGRDFQKKGY